MILKNFLKKLKAFDCEALNNKEVAHYFVSSNVNGYEEIVTDVVFDPKNNRIVLICDSPKQKLWDSSGFIKCESNERDRK